MAHSIASEPDANIPHEKQEKMPDPPRCRLLQLPVELQTQIYELASVCKGTIRVHNSVCVGYGGGNQKAIGAMGPVKFSTLRHCEDGLRLSQMCRRVRTIALPIYFSRNTFEACCCWVRDREEGLKPLRKWLSGIGLSNRRLLKDFHVHDNGDYMAGYTELHASVSAGLRNFEARATDSTDRRAEGEYYRLCRVTLSA
ncbi:hypothetical protein LTR35_004813 [Friedmanniomyces endolithicus]|nr:hypothetical protein LTR35_004813 [Friedmanniomyces endolithicus]KAK0299279.1 hypothetical protein LTS00_002390 [Friedmanniomyces endolithicus]